MSYAVGSLVKTRGREWVVLPSSTEQFLLLRPLGGTEAETAGVYLPLEGHDVQPAQFAPPDPQEVGNFTTSRLLRDAVRLGFRSSAGPFRSFARINLEPRPYQLVPLLMALKQDPVRLLIADDVGIGKTIEAGLIARELLDRGEIQRLAVLCPPHLAEQWQAELAEKFHIQAELVLSSTARRLEKNLMGVGQSIFDLYPYVIVSTEFIKSSQRRDDFVRSCPEFVIVDEAHTCAFSTDNQGGRHLRHQLVKELAADTGRHLVLVTATPHSGNEGAFRSLLGLLRPEFLNLPVNLSGREHEAIRREVAHHLVQRRRADIRAFMDENTTFPEREEAEEGYNLDGDYKKFFQQILEYAKERVADETGSKHQQRVRWWSVLALLRSLASSPAAAGATLRSRSGTIDTETPEEADTIGENSVLDMDDTNSAELIDVAPGGQDSESEEARNRSRLQSLARQADQLCGPQHDVKLKKGIALVKQLLKDKYNPILFCRFIPTAEYVAQELRQALGNKIEVVAVTGLLPPAERELRIQQMGEHPQRVLVATDCLSEGINLQQYFNAVIHYDLSWNPTRHEQREGRVDRYGQPSPIIRTITYYGLDNQIDGLVLEVLLRKHKTIRSSLGISVPLPANTGQVVQALMNGVLFKGGKVPPEQMTLGFLNNMTTAELQLDWENVSRREKESRTLFAQRTIDVQEVAQEWQAVREAIGTAVDVERFMRQFIQAHEGAGVADTSQGVKFNLPVSQESQALREVCGGRAEFVAQFTLPVPDKVLYLSRTHPLVEGVASYAMNSALDPLQKSVVKRSGVITTHKVQQKTTLLLLRYRYHIITYKKGQEIPLLAEACEMVGFTGRPGQEKWLSSAEVEAILTAEPTANTDSERAVQQMQLAIQQVEQLTSALNQLVEKQGKQLLEAHQRVRLASRQTGVRYAIQPQFPADVLGVYLLLPQI